MNRFSLAVVFFTVLSGLSAARGSDPIGIYAVVDRVVLEPGEGVPERIQIWGAFTLAGPPGSGDTYAPTVRGYLYYAIESGNEEATRKEWSDIGSLAGTGHCLGFVSRYAPKGTVRSGCDAAANPDLYALNGIGVTKFRDNPDYLPLLNLRSVPTPISPADGSAVGPGPITLVAQNVADELLAGSGYTFEIRNSSGAFEGSPEVPSGEGSTSWIPAMQARPGLRYDWSVRTVGDDWIGLAVSSCFTVELRAVRGDVNADFRIDISDPVYVLSFLFLGGPAPEPLEAADVDASGKLELTDGIYLLNFLFQGGPPPVPLSGGS